MLGKLRYLFQDILNGFVCAQLAFDGWKDLIECNYQEVYINNIVLDSERAYFYYYLNGTVGTHNRTWIYD